MAADKKWKDGLPSTREWQDRARAKIQASNLLTIAIKAAMGEEEISTSRAAMIRTLLDRVLPAQTQADVTTTTTDAPADMQALKQAIAQSPELQAMLKGLLSNGGTNQSDPTAAATPANTHADLTDKTIGKDQGTSTSNVDGWTKVSTTDSDGKQCDVYVPPSPSLPLN